MKDRNTQYPGRKKLTIISQSSSEIVADVERYEGTVTEAGTPLNTANLLSDDTAVALGLTSTATPDDAFKKVGTVDLAIQELYKPLIAPLSVSLSGFAAGSYLRYGKFYNKLQVFVKVSKTTAMSGTTWIGTLPAGYRPTLTQDLTAYDTDGNIIADVIVRSYATGGVYLIGNVDANTVILASYKGA